MNWTNRIKAAVFLCLCAVCLGGCSTRELEERCFPLVLEIGTRGGQLVFACAWPDSGEEPGQMNETAAQSGAMEKNDSQITRVIAPSVEDALRGVQNLQDKYVDYSQVKAVLLRKEVLEKEDLLEEILDWLEGTPEIARNILIFETDDLSLEKVLERADGQPGAYLEHLYKNNEKYHGEVKSLQEELYP